MSAVALEGLLLGLLLSVLIGPVFFLLVETSVNQGIKAAIVVDVGVILSDFLWITGLYFGAAGLLANIMDTGFAYLIGALIFIGFGSVMIFQRINTNDPPVKVHQGNNLIKGFVLNALNPSVAIFWLGAVSLATAELEGDFTSMAIFFGCVLSTVFVTDLIKIIAAEKLLGVLKHGMRQWFRRAIGLLIIALGIIFLIHYFQKL